MEEQEKNQPKTETQSKTHPHAKLLMIVTAVVVAVALTAIASYVGRTLLLDNQQPAAPTANQKTQEEPTNPKAAAEELKNLNLDEIKGAVEEIKTIIAAF